MCRWLNRFVTSNPFLIIFTIIILNIFLWHQYPTYIKDFISASSLIITALLTAWVSLNQFYIKQQTLRFQKYYFEDTLYTLAQSVDNIMRCSTNNIFTIESFRNKQHNITKLKIDVHQKKSALIEVFKETQTKFIVTPSISTFSLHTTQCLLKNSTQSSLTTWLKDIEIDSIRVSQYLQVQLSMIELLLEKLNENNIAQLEDSVKENIENRTHILHGLIKRHDILFNWVSIIIFYFSSADYSNNRKILEFWGSPLIKEILNNINLAYTSLGIASELDFSKVTKEQVEQFQVTMDDHYKKIAIFQNKYKSVLS